MSSAFLRFDHSDDPPPPMPVEHAIARGQRVVNRPVKVLIAAGVILALIGFRRSPWFVLAAPLGWVVGWCWWSYAAPRWRSWAIARGVHPRALQWYAEKNQLLWPKGHWGERTEFGSAAVRRSQQPAEPFHGVDSSGASPSAAASATPGFLGPPSNQSFLLGVVYWTVAMPAGMSLVNLFRDATTPISESVFTGLLTGILLAALAYRRDSWRAAVNPEHAFGLGLMGTLLMVAVSMRGEVPLSVPQIVLGSLLLLGPVSLMITAIGEWRRRRGLQS